MSIIARQDTAEDVVKEINGKGVEAISIKADVANENEGRSMIDHVVQMMGESTSCFPP